MEHWLDLEDRKIFYRKTGQGKPVLLVHGFGEDGSVWEEQVESLARNNLLLIPDLPGSGRSPLVPDMSMEGLARVLRSLLDQEGIDRCCLIGHSMGGYAGLAFAELFGEYLTAFGLFHSSAYADNPEKIATRRKGIEFIREYGAFEFLKNTSPNLFSPGTREERPDLVQDFIDKLSNFSDESLVHYYDAMIARPDRTSILKTASFPILFIMGVYDNAVPIKDSLEQCHLPYLSYIHIFKKSGHMGMMEEPQTTIIVLTEFLKSLP